MDGDGGLDALVNNSGGQSVLWLNAPQYCLTVASGRGVPDPVVGVHKYVEGAGLTPLVPLPTVTEGATQYVVAGWTMTGNEPLAGVGSSFAMTVTNAALLTWNWSTNYLLDTETDGNGSVDVADTWYLVDDVASITATPDTNFTFGSWSGSLGHSEASANPVTVTMSVPRQVTANFTADLAPGGTPIWWLASFGYSAPWGAAESSDTDADGRTAAQEYKAGTDPTLDSSEFRISAITSNPWKINFTSRTDRAYLLECRSGLQSGTWQIVFPRGGPRLGVDGVDSFEIDLSSASGSKVYRLRSYVP